MSQFERVCSRAAFLTSVFLCHAGILPELSTHLCSFHPFSVSIKTFSEVKCSCEACASLLSTWNKSLKLIFFTLTEGSWVKKTSQWLIKNVWMSIRSQQTVGSFVSDVLNHLLFHLKRSTPFHKRKMFSWKEKSIVEKSPFPHLQPHQRPASHVFVWSWMGQIAARPHFKTKYLSKAAAMKRTRYSPACSCPISSHLLGLHFNVIGT